MATKGRLVLRAIVFLTGIQARIDVDMIVVVLAAVSDGVDVVVIPSLDTELHEILCELVATT